MAQIIELHVSDIEKITQALKEFPDREMIKLQKVVGPIGDVLTLIIPGEFNGRNGSIHINLVDETDW